jgi:hypothetical protein
VIRIEQIARRRSENRSLILRAWCIDCADQRNDDANSFGIDEREDLVLLQRSTNRGCPLVDVIEIPLHASMFIEPAVRI